jgi:CxxC motif-containing protein
MSEKTGSKEITCILCPMGCRASVVFESGKIPRVENVECPRGKDYVRSELKTPRRDFFTTIQVKGGNLPLCSVRTTQPVPKDQIQECSLALGRIVIEAPIVSGQIIVRNILGLGMDVIATRDVLKV